MATLADQLIGNLVNAGGLIGGSLVQARDNAQISALRQQELSIRQATLSAAQQQQHRALQQQQQYQADLAAYSSNPTPQALAQLMMRYPEQAEAIKKGYDVLEAPAKESRLTTLFSLHNAAKNGRADLALGQIDSIIKAEKRQGLDTADAEHLQAALQSPDEETRKEALTQVQAFAQAHLAIVDPKFAQTIGAVPDNENHFGQLGSGGLFDQRTGQVLREPQGETKIIKNADGTESIVQIGEGGGQASGGAGGSGGGSGTPRSVRNNNPGNLRGGPFSQSQPGYKGVDSAGYAIFTDENSGAAAQAKLLQSRYISRGQNTVRSIIEGVDKGGKRTHGYAPRMRDGGDNTDAQVDNYIGYVAKQLGISPDDSVPTERLGDLARAMSRFESGATGKAGSTRTPAGGSTGARVVFTSKPAQGSAVDEATVNFYADKIAAGGDLPALGSGKESAEWRRRILARAAEIQRGAGVSGGNSNLAQADVRANRSALLQAQKQYTATVGFEDTLQRNVKEVLRLAPQGVGGSAPIFNRWIQAGRKSISGDPAVSAFNVAINTAANEYAKLASGASGGAVTSDSARHEAMEILNNAQTLPQLQAAIRQMQIDGHNRVLALDTQIKRLRGNISGAGVSGKPVPVMTPAQVAKAPSGTVFRTTDGRTMRKR